LTPKNPKGVGGYGLQRPDAPPPAPRPPQPSVSEARRIAEEQRREEAETEELEREAQYLAARASSTIEDGSGSSHPAHRAYLHSTVKRGDTRNPSSPGWDLPPSRLLHRFYWNGPGTSDDSRERQRGW
jgi:hypothetical protein